MEYLPDLDIGSILPDLSDLSSAVQSARQGWEQLTQIDSLYVAVAGGFLLFCIVVIIALKKWKARQTQESQTKSHEKHKEKPRGIKNIKNEETDKVKVNKWKKPDSKISAQEPKEMAKPTWFGGFTENVISVKKEKSPETECKRAPEEKKKGWLSFSKQESSKQGKYNSETAESTDSLMKPHNLNIDLNARPRDVTKKKTENEIQRVRKMCGEFREVVKVANKEDREEKQKDVEKVRSARSYFKTADKYRSESLSGNPRIKFRTEEEVTDSYIRGNQNRLSQFTPGKINSRFTDLFGGEPQPDVMPQKAPKKKIITLDQVLKQGSPKSDENRITKEMELEDLKQSRKQWKPPQLEKNEPISNVKDEIITLQFESMPLKLRWNPKEYSAIEDVKSLEVPNKLNIEQVFPSKATDGHDHTKIEVERELDELRLSRPKRFHKVAKEERSSSVHVLQRVKLPDDSWVVEKSESRIAEERRKAIEELELVKRTRLETLEALENMELERPSSRLEDQVRFEAMKELDEVRRARTVTMQEDEVKSEVIKILNQLSDEVSNQITTNNETTVTHDSEDKNQLNQDVSNQINNDENTKVNDGAEHESQLDEDISNQITTDEDMKVTHAADNGSQLHLEFSNQITTDEDMSVTDDNNQTNQDILNQITTDEDTNSTLTVSDDSQLCQEVSNQITTDEDTKVTDDADDNNQVDQDISNQLTSVKDINITNAVDDENNRLRSDQFNGKTEELEILEMEKEITEENETADEAQANAETQEQLEERVGELTAMDIAMAIAAEGMLEFEEFKGTQVYEEESYEELDEDFEQKKKIIEEELRLIEEQYKAVLEQASQDVTTGTEEIIQTETYEELTERLLKVAESIQESAKRLGHEEIHLTPRIDRIQILRDECQVTNQSLPGKDNTGENVNTEVNEKHNQESIKSDEDENISVNQNDDDDETLSASDESQFHLEVSNQITTDEQNGGDENICMEQNEVDTNLGVEQNDIPQVLENVRAESLGVKYNDGDENLSVEQNYIPQITEDAINTIKPKKELKQDLAQFEPAKINNKFKNIFENKGNNEEIQVRRQPKKKLITLDQVLLKSSSQDINNDKEVELEIVKNLRKNWVPPEDLDVEISKTKLEPKRLQISHVYGNDTKGGTEKLKLERQNELEEVRQTAPIAARWRSEETGDAKEEKRPRPRSAMKVTQSDDFWLKEKSNTKVEEEKQKVIHEIESIKQARLKFEDEPINRQENDARLKTLQELESLRSNQKQLDSSVRKIKRDLEEINRNVVEKETTERTTDFQTPTQQWNQEREKIKESFNTKLKLEEEIKPVVKNTMKLNKITVQEEIPEKDVILSTSVEAEVIKVDADSTLEDKARSKLKEIKSLEIFKLKEKTIKLTKKIETERGRKRELRQTLTKEGASLRSKSISSLKNAGQKIKNLTNDKLKNVMKSKTAEDHEEEETKKNE